MKKITFNDLNFYTLMILSLIILVALTFSCDSTNAEMIDDLTITFNSTVEYSGEAKVDSPITIKVTGFTSEMSYGFKVMPEYNINPGNAIHGQTIVHIYRKPGKYFIKGAGQDINGVWTLTNSGKYITISE